MNREMDTWQIVGNAKNGWNVKATVATVDATRYVCEFACEDKDAATALCRYLNICSWFSVRAA